MKHKLFRFCLDHQLTRWHYRAALILLDINGYANALAFLESCAHSPAAKNTKLARPIN